MQKRQTKKTKKTYIGGRAVEIGDLLHKQREV